MFRTKSGHSRINVEESYFLAADFFLSFSNPTALMILNLVRKKELTPLAISKKLGTTAETILPKLRAMERERILISRVSTRNTFYRIADQHIVRAFDQILKFPEKKLTRAGAPETEFQANRRKDGRSCRRDSFSSVR